MFTPGQAVIILAHADFMEEAATVVQDKGDTVVVDLYDRFKDSGFVQRQEFPREYLVQEVATRR